MQFKCKLMKILGSWPNLKRQGLEKRRKKIELRAFLHTIPLLLSKLLRISKRLALITSLVHQDLSMVMLPPQPYTTKSVIFFDRNPRDGGANVVEGYSFLTDTVTTKNPFCP